MFLFRVIIAPSYRLNQFQFRQALPARLRDYVRGGGMTTSGKGCPRSPGTILKFIVLTLTKIEFLKTLINNYTYSN